MRTTFDFAPLFRSSVGFDRMLDALKAASHVTTIGNWPPYDIIRSGEDEYRITMAVAGLTEADLTLTQEQNLLVVAGRKAGDDEDNGRYLYRGIADGAFERRFERADHVKVVGASLSDGMLTIDLKREIPPEILPPAAAARDVPPRPRSGPRAAFRHRSCVGSQRTRRTTSPSSRPARRASRRSRPAWPKPAGRRRRCERSPVPASPHEAHAYGGRCSASGRRAAVVERVRSVVRGLPAVAASADPGWRGRSPLISGPDRLACLPARCNGRNRA